MKPKASKSLILASAETNTSTETLCSSLSQKVGDLTLQVTGARHAARILLADPRKNCSRIHPG